VDFPISQKGRRAHTQPISYLMAQGLAGESISLAAGLVDAETLPAEEVTRCAAAMLAQRGRESLQYGTTEGLLSLREKVRERLCRADGVDADDIPVDRVFLSTGSQQMLYILTELMVDPGDIVITPAPTYFVYLGTLETAGADVRPVETDGEGMRPEAFGGLLEEIEAEGKAGKVKIVYTASYFQNPSGVSLSPARRKELVETLNSLTTARPLVIEDAAYRELRFEGGDTPSLWSFAGGRGVAYLGTFSKPFSPGLRTGFAVLPEEILEQVRVIKGNHDFGSANFSQHVVDRFLEEGLYDRHVRKLRAAYAEKCGLMCECLERELGERAEWLRPGGGLYVWVRVPGLDTGLESALFKRCVANGVIYVPGAFAYPAGRAAPKDRMRLSFGPASKADIREGVSRLAKSITEVSHRVGTGGRTV